MGKILIVDDSADLIHLFTIIVKRRGHEVAHASCARQALEAIYLSPPDLILLDVLLSDGNGRNLCQLIKSKPETAFIKIVLLSAHPPSLENYRECDADAVLSKPFELAEMEEVIARFVPA